MDNNGTTTTPVTATAVNLRTRSSGVVHAAVNDLPACPARPRATSPAGAYTETQEPVSCKHCLKLTATEPAERVEVEAPAQPAEAREYGVRGTVNTPEGVQVRVYAGESLEHATTKLLRDLHGVQQRGGLAVDGAVVSRTPGGEWEPIETTRHDDSVQLVDVTALTPAQLDGITCVRCGTEADRMLPAGTVAGYGQVFQCSPACAPSEPTSSACPAWCDGDDHGGDPVGERAHWSATSDLPLSLEDLVDDVDGGTYRPALLAELLNVESDTRGTHIHLSDNVSATWGRKLTVAEADELADHLRDLTAQARASQVPVPRPAKPMPFWQTVPCPAWCDGLHDDGDHPDDRGHYSGLHTSPLTQEPPVQVAPNVWGPEELHLSLHQGEREAVPVVRLSRGGRTDRMVTMTLAEAEQTHANLGALLAEARAARPAVTAHGCALWCVQHDDCTEGGRHPADPRGGMCRAGSAPLPGGRYGRPGHVDLTYDAEDGHLIQINNDSDAVLTLEEAERHARTVLDRVALARTTIPASPAPLENVEGACSDPACRICKTA
ncbi:DUF6907 domain-containing protein [Streptosporangium fragile]|uniref:DUF6907 domain-containing protein n=1 Tax=Streptosporangium fragile TaxID=46186 RepID=UPI0031E5552B